MIRVIRRFAFCFSVALNCCFIATLSYIVCEPEVRGFFAGLEFRRGCHLRHEDYELIIGEKCSADDFVFRTKTENGNVRWTRKIEGETMEDGRGQVICNDILANGFWIAWKQDRVDHCYDILIQYNDFSYFDKEGMAEKVILLGKTTTGTRWMKLANLAQMSNCLQQVEK